jgi:asparagine synthetase B (glutamine-hydrolysing)
MQWHVGFLSVGTQTETALLGRDRFGVKPLFYTHTGTVALCFSSEMKGLSMHL